MEYRIKVIEKNNGYKEYIPQYFDMEMMSHDMKWGILFLPIAIIYFVFNPLGLFTLSWWKNIEYYKPYFGGFQEFHTTFTHGHATCSTREDALTIVAIHKGCKLQESGSKKQEKESSKAQETKKVTYIKL